MVITGEARQASPDDGSTGDFLGITDGAPEGNRTPDPLLRRKLSRLLN
jgi:hypothetical protein